MHCMNKALTAPPKDGFCPPNAVFPPPPGGEKLKAGLGASLAAAPLALETRTVVSLQLQQGLSIGIAAVKTPEVEHRLLSAAEAEAA